ncbi:hypothetical protein D9M70_588910 [compost metagenome]
MKATRPLINVPALLASTPGVSRNSREFRSFFSATIRFSRRYCATIGAGMPCSVYAPVALSNPGVSSVSLLGSVIAKPGAISEKPCHAAPGARCQKAGLVAS